MFNKLQSLPKWAWLTVGVLFLVLPESLQYLISNGVNVPDPVIMISKFILWISGFNPYPVTKNLGS